MVQVFEFLLRIMPRPFAVFLTFILEVWLAWLVAALVLALLFGLGWSFAHKWPGAFERARARLEAIRNRSPGPHSHSFPEATAFRDLDLHSFFEYLRNHYFGPEPPGFREPNAEEESELGFFGYLWLGAFLGLVTWDFFPSGFRWFLSIYFGISAFVFASVVVRAEWTGIKGFVKRRLPLVVAFFAFIGRILKLGFWGVVWIAILASATLWVDVFGRDFVAPWSIALSATLLLGFYLIGKGLYRFYKFVDARKNIKEETLFNWVANTAVVIFVSTLLYVGHKSDFSHLVTFLAGFSLLVPLFLGWGLAAASRKQGVQAADNGVDARAINDEQFSTGDRLGLGDPHR